MTKGDMRKRLDIDIVELYALRDKLLAIIEDVEEIRHEMHNRSPIMRAPSRSKKVTPEIRTKVRDIHKKHPDWSQTTIGLVCNIDSGRVSEILAGKRT